MEVRILDIIDILLVALLLFQLYKLLRGSLAYNIFVGILFIYLFWLLVRAFNMQLLSTILGQFIGVGVLAVLIVFQPEIRRFLLFIGQGKFFSRDNFWRSLFVREWNIGGEQDTFVLETYKACQRLADNRRGALIVIAGTSRLQFFADTGVKIDAIISADTLESIFYKNAPLHDGAVIIAENKILAAKCVLPVSDNPDLPSWVGMRHRSAVGITEHSDAIAVAISEETGDISYAQAGRLHPKITLEELYSALTRAYKVEVEQTTSQQNFESTTSS